MADDTKKPPPDLSPEAVIDALAHEEKREHKRWRSSIRSPEASGAHPDRGRANRVGPYKLTDDVQKKIVGGILLGMSMERAAQAAGIHRVTVFRWLKAGAEGEEPYLTFLRACQQADAECEGGYLRTIKEASLGIRNENGSAKQWTAAAWALERRFHYLAPKGPWIPEQADASQSGAAGAGVSLADVVGASAAQAANLSDAPPVDPAVRIRELEAEVAALRVKAGEVSSQESAASDSSEPADGT